jgi:Cd2+/Zn2+-exporting ATPase
MVQVPPCITAMSPTTAPSSSASPAAPEHDHDHGFLPDAWQLPIAIAAGIALVIGFVLHAWVGEALEHPALMTTGMVLIWISLGLGAIPGTAEAWESLRKLRPDIDVLMVVGAGLAAGIGHPEDGALLLFLFTLAHGLEHRAMDRARDAVSRLSKLMPTDAIRRDADGSWVSVPPESLVKGEVVRIRPGETVPCDAVILDGASSIDQSSLTGESFPRDVRKDDAIYAGTINGQGSLEAEVTAPVTQSSLQRVLQLVLEAQERRLPVQRMIDTFSTPYAVSVFVVAILTCLGFWLLSEMAFADALYRAITLLIVCSPCALVIATPTATLCGLSRAARAGVLIKGGDALERLAGIQNVALDKTGTLTTGQIEVTHLHPIAASPHEAVLHVASGVEMHSTHPIARAVLRLAEAHAISPVDVKEIQNVPGSGIQGTYENKPVRIGSYDFCEPLIPVCFRPHTRKMVEQTRHDGGMPVVLTHDDHTLVLVLEDQPRPGADRLAKQLHDVGVQRVAMLTGDHPVIAQRLAEQLGIDFVRAQLLPEDKVSEIEHLRADPASQGGLAVIGDGVNDAPALAVADVGLAMGAIGADAALETADVVLLHDHLEAVPWSIGLARRVKRIMRMNLAFATGVIVVLAVLTLIGLVPMSLGVLGHEGSTLLVVANSLQLLAHRPPSAVG